CAGFENNLLMGVDRGQIVEFTPRELVGRMALDLLDCRQPRSGSLSCRLARPAKKQPFAQRKSLNERGGNVSIVRWGYIETPRVSEEAIALRVKLEAPLGGR